jgi:oligopeptide/dipeptide ABC transporter ATP-binding protein
MALLEVEDLAVRFKTLRGEVHAVNGVDLAIDSGETVALVGESGCGKSVTALAILGLLGRNASITRGHVCFDSRDLIRSPESELRKLRGASVSMIFQDPMTSLNPVMTVGAQIREILEVHTPLRGGDARRRAIQLLDEVGIPDPARRADQYPHQFSGGMRQRAVIAIAIACNPRLLIADEPTTALDVTVQAQILSLLGRLIADHRMALLLITHDLGVVADTCTTTNVMYGGRVVETATTRDLFHHPTHPYTVALLRSIPKLDGVRKVRLAAIAGQPPVLRSAPVGCTFAARCPRALERCRVDTPVREPEGSGRVACWNPVADSSPAGTRWTRCDVHCVR